MNNDKKKEVLTMIAGGKSQAEAALEAGVSTSAVHRVVKSCGVKASTAIKDNQIIREYSDETGQISTKSTQWKTLADALKAAQVDLDIWEVDRHLLNSWDVSMKDPAGEPITVTNYQIKIWLKRLTSNADNLSSQIFVDRIIKSGVKCTKRTKRTKHGDVMLELCLYDNHFGMLSWDAETGDNYDLKIAEAYYVNAVEDLLEKSAHTKIDKIVFPIGQDFFHINSPSMSTPRANNRLDVDGRLAKVLEVGKMAVLRAVEMCRQVARVEMMWVPGNHDPETSYNLIQIIGAYYHSDRLVKVDTSPRARKCVVYGDCAVGMTHGCDEPSKSLPSIFRDDFDEFAKAKHKEIHIGHLHKKKEMQFISADTFGPVTVRTIPSLCSTDAWHYSKGYIGKIKAAQSFIWHKKDGLQGTYYTYARE